jgi:hypothetical protein
LLIKSRDIQTVEINGAGNNHMRVHRSEIWLATVYNRNSNQSNDWVLDLISRYRIFFSI